MEEEEFLNSDDQQKQIRYSIERYEEMIRNKDAYFFDVDAFVNIVDYYIEKNDPVKALQVIEYAQDQHPDSVEFLLREAQLLAMVERFDDALAIIAKAEKITPLDPDLYMIRGSIYSQLQQYEKAIESFNQAIPLAEDLDLLYLNLAYVYESWGDYNKAIEYLMLSLDNNPENEIALYEIAFCFDASIRGKVICRGGGMVDAGDLKSPGFSRAGSSPALGIIFFLSTFQDSFKHRIYVILHTHFVPGLLNNTIFIDQKSTSNNS